MTSPIGLPIIEIRKISEKLWDHKRVIDEYILSGFKALDEEETEIVSSWKRAVRGGFDSRQAFMGRFCFDID